MNSAAVLSLSWCLLFLFYLFTMVIHCVWCYQPNKCVWKVNFGICFTIWGFYLLYLHLFVLFHIKYVHVTVFPFRGLLNNSGHTEMDAPKCLQVGFRISEWAAWNCWLGYRSNSGSTVRVTVICSTLLDHISWHQRTWKEEPHMLGNADLADWCLLYSNGVSMGCWRKCLAPGETDHQHGCDKHIKAQKQEMHFRIYGKKSDQCCNYKEKQQNERNQISSSKK